MATKLRQSILILGAGELGLAITEAFLSHEIFHTSTVSLTVAIRPRTLADLQSDSKSTRTKELISFRDRGVAFTSCDLVADSEDTLCRLFASYDTVLHAGAMTLPAGSQLKVTRSVLAAKVAKYMPWQYGVDYDVIGPDGGQGLFSEQCEVRRLLRSQTQTKWYILSCGIFMSFLFEDFWGVIVRDEKGFVTGVRALGGWDHLLTVTTVEDIARCVAELLLVNADSCNEVTYIAGDTVRYDNFAEIVERVIGHAVRKEEWTTKYLTDESVKDPENKLLKYRVVFSEGCGLAWEKEGTFNNQKGVAMESIEAYVKRLNIQ